MDDIDKEVSAKMGSSPPLPKLPRGIEAWIFSAIVPCNISCTHAEDSLDLSDRSKKLAHDFT